MNDISITESITDDIESFENKKSFSPITLSKLMTIQFSETEWIVEKLIPAEGIIVISGTPSAYKTWFILDLALTIARGGVLFDQFPTNKQGVLIIDEETGDRWVQQRIKKLPHEDTLPVYLLSKSGFRLTTENTKQLKTYSKDNAIGVIIFDSFVRVSTARDENSATEIAKVFRQLQELTKAGITVVFTHHNRKPGLLRSSSPSQDMRGSSDILAAVDCHIAIDRNQDALTVSQTKLRQGEELQPFKLLVMNDEDEFRFEYGGEIDELKTKKADFKKSISELLSKSETPLYKKELFDQLRNVGVEGGYSTFKSAIEELLEKGELYQQRGEGNRLYLSIKPFEDGQRTLIT